MKVYVTVIPDDKDIIKLDPTSDSIPMEKLSAVLTFGNVMMRDKVPTRIVITNMERERAGFRKASEL